MISVRIAIGFISLMMGIGSLAFEQKRQDEWSLRFLADVPAVENGYMPGGASMSPSGKTLAVFHYKTDFFTLVRYDEQKKGITVRKEPCPSDLQSYRAIIHWATDGIITLTGRDKVPRTAALPEELRYEATCLSGGPKVYFEDITGRHILPGDMTLLTFCEDGHGFAGVRKLFVVQGDTRQEVTTDVIPTVSDGVYWFLYDEVKRRVVARAGNRCIVYDIDSETRRLLPTHKEMEEGNPKTATYVDYYPVMGGDYVMALNTPDEDNEGRQLGFYSVSLARLDGQIVQVVPISFSGIEDRYILVDEIFASKYLVAFVAYTRGQKAVVKVYEVVRGAEE